MSSCEKCWSDAHGDPYVSVAERYQALIEERRATPCSPEEQAGPDAGQCPRCLRHTLHQHTHECMVPECLPGVPASGKGA